MNALLFYRPGGKGKSLRGTLLSRSIVLFLLTFFFISCALLLSPCTFAEDSGSITCVIVPPIRDGFAWGKVCAGQIYQYTANGTIYHCKHPPGGPSSCPTDPDGWQGHNAGSYFLCPERVPYSLVAAIGEISTPTNPPGPSFTESVGDCFQLGTSGTFTASKSGTLYLYFNDDDYADNTGWFNCCIGLSNVTLVAVDAQGFEPQLDGNDASLQVPISNAVDSAYNRIGALTDGASLIVLQLSPSGCAGWTVQVSDPNDDTLGAAQVGSLWGGDENSLPPLPATLADPGDTTLVLQDGQTALFYRPPPSWAFGSGTKEHNIQFQVFDENTNVVATTPFILHKPPLVLVHGLFDDPTVWNTFKSTLSGYVDFDPYEANYSNNNTSGFDIIFTAVPVAIRTALGDSRINGIAATRVDVVAHSMGGNATRWYMTPSSHIPDNSDRTSGGTVLFKTTTIHSTRAAQDQFIRPDNFGIGDIRRFITMGTPHTGTSLSGRAIEILNSYVTGRSYKQRELRKNTMFIEHMLRFTAIGLSEPGAATDSGMAIVDLAAYGTQMSGAQAPSRSAAVNFQAAIPVEYVPVEATAYSRSFGLQNTGAWFLQRMLNLVLDWPADIQAEVSDLVVPSLSARNLTAYRDNYDIRGVYHWDMPKASIGPMFRDLLGPSDAMFVPPEQ